MARLASGLAALAVWSLAAAPAQAQVCLDCFTELLGANPFTAPVILPGQAVGTLMLGLAGPVDSAAWLPNLQGKYGLVDGVEVAGTLGYEPSLGLRAVAASAGPVTLLGTARGGYAYFRREWLVQAAAPVLWTASPDLMVRLEPGMSVIQLTGNHLTFDLAISRRVAPGTAIALVLAPDYLIAAQQWSGAASVVATRSLSPRWSVYGLGAVSVVNEVIPLGALGLTYAPPPPD